ncbi:MAG: ornithine aminotransferase [Planctomycetota bacterium]|nr:MAG: ornithine aminotransferase [Planctomycetota bacterium]
MTLGFDKSQHPTVQVAAALGEVSRRHVELNERYGTHNYKPLPVVIAEGRGCWVTDVEGRRYLDMLSAYSALNFGHNHPAIVDAVRTQLDRVTVTSRAFFNDQLGPFFKELAELTGMDRVLPMNTGAEAVETAIKTARKWAYQVKGVAPDRARILAFAGNFHGRTTTIISFSTDPLATTNFGPFTPGFDVVPYGDLAAVEQAVTGDTAAVLVEPIQGEAGVVLPPPGFLTGLRKLCTDRNVLLICDEIQTGLGRTGRMFAFEHEGVRPDVVTLGKALGGGLIPVSAVVGIDAAMGVFKPGEHGSTFGGNPLAAAVGRKAIELLRTTDLVERARSLGEYFRGQLEALRSPIVQEVRGRGLLIGVQIKPEAGPARPMCEALLHDGLLCKDTQKQVIRFAPPLIIERAEIDWAMERIAVVLSGR